MLRVERPLRSFQLIFFSHFHLLNSAASINGQLIRQSRRHFIDIGFRHLAAFRHFITPRLAFRRAELHAFAEPHFFATEPAALHSSHAPPPRHSYRDFLISSMLLSHYFHVLFACRFFAIRFLSSCHITIVCFLRHFVRFLRFRRFRFFTAASFHCAGYHFLAFQLRLSVFTIFAFSFAAARQPPFH